MTTPNLFEYAARNKLRFNSPRGLLTAEDLWDIPLRARNADGLDLNAVAKIASKALAETAENFVDTTKTADHTRREMALEVVKYVIDTKINEEKAAAAKADKKKTKETLLAALAEKQAGKLSAMSEKELKRQIEALDDD
jgi:hypothetical protein